MQVAPHRKNMVHVIVPRPVAHGLGEKEAVGKEDGQEPPRPQHAGHFAHHGNGPGQVIDRQGCRCRWVGGWLGLDGLYWVGLV